MMPKNLRYDNRNACCVPYDSPPPGLTAQLQRLVTEERPGACIGCGFEHNCRRDGCAVLHDTPELKDARAKLHAYLAPHAPAEPITGPVRLLVKWLFPADGRHPDGAWKTTKPDTDNLDKALKDEMTRLHFWQDDAQVCSEISEKFWADLPGIYIEILPLTPAKA